MSLNEKLRGYLSYYYIVSFQKSIFGKKAVSVAEFSSFSQEVTDVSFRLQFVFVQK
jgi:hypothetical protein